VNFPSRVGNWEVSTLSHRSIRDISRETGIHRLAVHRNRIIHRDLHLNGVKELMCKEIV